MVLSISSRHRSHRHVRMAALGVVLLSFFLVLLVLSTSGCGSSSSSASSSPTTTASSSAVALDSLTPGVLMEAIEPYMPYTNGIKPGVVNGLDGEIISAVAQKLGLKVDYKNLTFPGMLAAIQTHRADIAYGGVAWTAERAKVGLFTDPYYYSPQTLTTVEGKPTYSTIASIKGKTVGTITGSLQVGAIQAAGAHLVVQPAAVGLVDQLTSGRLDAAVLDPLIAAYTAKQRPELHLVNTPLQAPTEAEVKADKGLAGFLPYSVTGYIPKQEPKLEAAMSAAIDEMYANGEMSALLTKWGVDPKVWLTPYATAASERIGVDRPANWAPPSLP
jgi:ABC-type amino acid transport substrate-binding protein